MSALYTFCEKCDLKIPADKESLAKGIVCPSCGDRFTPKKLNRVDDSGRDLAVTAIIGIVLGASLLVVSFFDPSSALSTAGNAILGTGLTFFVIAQLLHIRAALEKLAGK